MRIPALPAAVGWFEAILIGTVATSVATVAEAVVGIMMLAGRIDWRRDATIVTDCFILFGAKVIATGLQSIVRQGGGSAYVVLAEVPPPSVVKASVGKTTTLMRRVCSVPKMVLLS